ncbi:MAG: NAD(P)/FAD-dependent oxidoreductase, partial [Proteobacteria bacterium]
YLARAGLSVVLLERREVVGGTAVTEEFHPGFRNSTASYTVSLLHPKIQADLRLAEHGLKVVERPLQNYLVEAPGHGLPLGPTLADTARALAARGSADADRLDPFHAHVDQAVELLRSQLLRTPPTDLSRWRDLWQAIAAGRAFRALSIPAQRAVLELFTRSAGDILDGWFEDPGLKAAYGFDSIVGSYASPYTPGSGYVLLHHAFGETNGKPGRWGHAIGGMGSITQAMAREVERLGGRIELGAPVRRVVVERSQARGVELEDGRVVRARHIVANVNPRFLYLRLLADTDVPESLRTALRNYRCGSATFRMNVALSELPDFSGRGGGEELLHRSGILISPSLGYMDRARHGRCRLPAIRNALRDPAVKVPNAPTGCARSWVRI